MKHLFGKAVWLVTGLTSLCVGLKTMGFDLEEMLNLSSVDTLLRYGVGLCGALSLIFLAMASTSSCGTCRCS